MHVWREIGYHHTAVDHKGGQLVEIVFRKRFIQVFSFQGFYAYEYICDKLSCIPFFLTANWKGFIGCNKEVIIDGGDIPVAFTNMEQTHPSFKKNL